MIINFILVLLNFSTNVANLRHQENDIININIYHNIFANKSLAWQEIKVLKAFKKSFL